MIFLAVETATPTGSIALGRSTPTGATILYESTWIRQRSHGELLTSMIETALSEKGFSIQDVDGFVTDIGPGSFTGLRVGLSAVRTLSYSTGKPIFTFNSLETLAAQAPFEAKEVLSIINAHKNQCYVAKFLSEPGTSTNEFRWRETLAPCAMTPVDLENLITAPILCVGEGFGAFETVFSREAKSQLLRDPSLSDFPKASTLVRLAASAEKTTQTIDWKALEPLYIRGSEAEEKLRSGVLKPLPEY